MSPQYEYSEDACIETVNLTETEDYHEELNGYSPMSPPVFYFFPLVQKKKKILSNRNFLMKLNIHICTPTYLLDTTKVYYLSYHYIEINKVFYLYKQNIYIKCESFLIYACLCAYK
jgi:hypothetical protein